MSREFHSTVGTEEISDEILAEIIDMARLDPLAAGMGIQKAHLKNILSHFRILSRIELGEADAAAHINPVPMPFQDDNVDDRISHDVALKNARNVTKEYYRVPRVPGQESKNPA